jgi:lysophospholipase L1-like esterase
MAFLSLEQPFDMRVEENKKFWSPDRLHFSELGYDKVGEMLFELMSKHEVSMAMDAKSLEECKATSTA